MEYKQKTKAVQKKHQGCKEAPKILDRQGDGKDAKIARLQNGMSQRGCLIESDSRKTG